jgi:hypothetical protein
MRLAALLAVLIPATALADDAEALFERGVKDMLAGRYDSGCPAIAESQKLDPRPGTIFTLAECEAKWGKVASAYAHYGEYLALKLPADGKQGQRREIAEKARAELLPRIPTITVSAPFEVTRGDAKIELGVALQVDPGEHVFIGGGKTERVTVAEGEKKSLAFETEKPAPRPPPIAPVAVIAPAPAPEKPRPLPGKDNRPLAFAVGGVGVLSLGAGVVTGIMALDRNSTLADNCPNKQCNASVPDPDAVTRERDTLATLSTICVAGGIVAVGVAVMILVRQPKRVAISPFSLRATF